jgi:hypothetical protein
MPVVSTVVAGRQWWRQLGLRLFALAILAAFVAAQDPLANLREHSHSRTQTHSCAACHSALLSAAAAPAAITLPPVAFTGWSTPPAAQSLPGSATVITHSSRAPPAASSLHLV